MNKKGFTLIELLAVIIILGVLMIIAIPSVTKYINDSRKNAYVSIAKSIANGARNLVNSGQLKMFDKDVTYYVPSSCIRVENGEKAKSPYGDFIDDKTYVVITYNEDRYDYYWISLDESGAGVKTITSINGLDESSIEMDLKGEDISTTLGVDGRKKIRIFSSDCSSYTDDTSRVLFNLVNGDKNNLKIGDELCIDTECFNIMAINGDNIKLLAKYNLYVGAIFDTSHYLVSIIPESDPNYLRQTTEEILSGPHVYGATEFSTTNYWHSSGNTYPMDIFDNTKNTKPSYNPSNGYMLGDSNCSIAYYVQEYGNLLLSKGVNIQNVRIPTKSEISGLSSYTFPKINGQFWLGTADTNDDVFVKNKSYIVSYRYTAYSTTGVRPCFDIKKIDIK